MAVSVVMPALEMAQETGKLVSWLKKEGDFVRKGEMLIEVETDKAVVEVEAAGEGILGGILVQAGDVVPVGQTIAWLLREGEQPPAATTEAAQTGRRVETTSQAATTAVAPAPRGQAHESARLSPRARRLAREHGIDVSKITGSGPGGEVLAEDVLRMAGPTPPADRSTPPAADVETLSSVGRLMAERTTASWTTVPHFFVTRDVDATALAAARDRIGPSVQAASGVKMTYTDLIVSAVARGLRRHPRMNASWTDAGPARHVSVNVGLAMAVDQAVVTAVVRDADRLGLADLAGARQGLAERAQSNRLKPADISGGTFTISNLGMYGVDAFTAIIVAPQAGILAVGAIVDRVVVASGQPVVRPMLTLTLSADHRVVDGAGAAAFLDDVVRALQDSATWTA